MARIWHTEGSDWLHGSGGQPAAAAGVGAEGDMTREEIKQAADSLVKEKREWRKEDNSLNATPDHQMELDEIFLDADHVHIERMDHRDFWIGVTLKDGNRVHIRTGVARGPIWYFNVEHDAENGSFYSVQRNLRSKVTK